LRVHTHDARPLHAQAHRVALIHVAQQQIHVPVVPRQRACAEYIGPPRGLLPSHLHRCG
jgi:hypothetical protein